MTLLDYFKTPRCPDLVIQMLYQETMTENNLFEKMIFFRYFREASLLTAIIHRTFSGKKKKAERSSHFPVLKTEKKEQCDANMIHFYYHLFLLNVSREQIKNPNFERFFGIM